jgi:hypothetical protein
MEALRMPLAVAAKPLQVVQMLLLQASELQHLLDANHSGQPENTLRRWAREAEATLARQAPN